MRPLRSIPCATQSLAIPPTGSSVRSPVRFSNHETYTRLVSSRGAGRSGRRVPTMSARDAAAALTPHARCRVQRGGGRRRSSLGTASGTTVDIAVAAACSPGALSAETCALAISGSGSRGAEATSLRSDVVNAVNSRSGSTSRCSRTSASWTRAAWSAAILSLLAASERTSSSATRELYGSAAARRRHHCAAP
jgi:hypothetical protein